MKVEVGKFLAPSSTGQVAMSLNDTSITIKSLEFIVASLSDTNENNVAHFSHGMTDGTHSFSNSILNNGFGYTRSYPNSVNTTAYCISHLAIVNNTLTRVISATLVSMSGGNFTLNFDRADNGYEIYYRAIGD